MKKKKILPDDEVNFLECLHEALYFKSGDKRFYLRNGVHQGSPLSPALFDIYMEEVMERLVELCEKPESGENGFTFWHKLYADDLVLCVHYKHVEVLLENLHRVSVDHDLLINPKKCAVIAVRNHAMISPDVNLQGIQVATEC